jgi:hypothetical protein
VEEFSIPAFMGAHYGRLREVGVESARHELGALREQCAAQVRCAALPV